MISVGSDQISTIESQSGAFGMIAVSDLAITAGVVSIPSPVTEGNDDGWFVWQPFVQTIEGSTSASHSEQYDFDSKGMRRIQEGFTIAIVAENSSATIGLDFQFAVAMLTSLS